MPDFVIYGICLFVIWSIIGTFFSLASTRAETQRRKILVANAKDLDYTDSSNWTGLK